MVCGLDGRREIRVCQNPEETFHLQQRLCLRREEAHCQKTGRRRLWNTDTAGLQVRLYQELKALKRFTRSLTEDVLQEVLIPLDQPLRVDLAMLDLLFSVAARYDLVEPSAAHETS